MSQIAPRLLDQEVEDSKWRLATWTIDPGGEGGGVHSGRPQKIEVDEKTQPTLVGNASADPHR